MTVVRIVYGLLMNLSLIATLAADDLSGSVDKNLAVRLLSRWGYLVILFAAFWEGEAVLITAGALCGAGYLDWRLTVLAAAIGGSRFHQSQDALA